MDAGRKTSAAGVMTGVLTITGVEVESAVDELKRARFGFDAGTEFTGVVVEATTSVVGRNG